MTHDEQALPEKHKLLDDIMTATTGPGENAADVYGHRIAMISTALAASHLAGWRAAREAAQSECQRHAEFLDRETRNGGNHHELLPRYFEASYLAKRLTALPDPVPAPTDPGRAARLAEIRERSAAEDRTLTATLGQCSERLTREYNDARNLLNAHAPADIAYLLSLIPEATR